MEAVQDTKTNSLAVISAYIEKAPTQQTENVQALSWNARNASADVEASNKSISQSGNDVNTQNNICSNTDKFCIENNIVRVMMLWKSLIILFFFIKNSAIYAVFLFIFY